MADIDLNEADQHIIDELKQGRNTPSNLASDLDYTREYVSQRLKRLREHDIVERVGRGLYELKTEDIAESDSSSEPSETSEAAEEDEEADYDIFETDSNAYPDAEAVRGATVSRDVIDEETEERIRDALAGSGDLLDARLNEILKMYMELKRQGEATKEELLSVVDVEATTYQDEGSVWSNMVKGKDTLKAIPGVQKPPRGKSTWTYTGENDGE